jgi:hypothetical protein
MPTNLYLRAAELFLTLLLAAALILAWRDARNDRAQLQSQLAAANQALTAATARQQDRDSKLTDTLSTIANEKKTPLTTDQLLAAIAQEAGLPITPTLQSQTNQPLGAGNQPPNNSLQPAGTSSTGKNSPSTTIDATIEAKPGATPNSASQNDLPNAPAAQIPESDLRPLYNYLLDCKACQAKLTAAQSDLADEKSKTSTLTQSRDAALKAAKGGTILQRTLRAAKWFALGALAGAAASKLHR